MGILSISEELSLCNHYIIIEVACSTFLSDTSMKRSTEYLKSKFSLLKDHEFVINLHLD